MKKFMEKSRLFLAAAIMAVLFFINPQTAKAATPLDALIQQYVGSVWNGEYHGKQCKGFANYIFYLLWDVAYIGPYSSQKYYIPNPSGAWEVGRLSFDSMSVDNAQSLLSRGLPGDFIQVRRRGKSYGHSMILVSKDAGGITVFDCNSDGRNGVKKYRITWSQFYSKNSAMSLYRANNNRGTATQDPTPTQNPMPAALPSITDVGIDDINFSHISLHFTANNAGLARVVFESRNTGKSVTRDYTSGLGRVSVDFSVLELPGTTEMNVLIYAYSTAGGGNETLHRVLYGSIPGVVQLPQGDEEIASLCFDPIFYADNNDDLRRAFGYDEAQLLNHWRNYGIAEGRAGSPIWNGKYYLQANTDVAAAYNNDYTMAYKHFINWGYKEKRASSEYYDGTYYQNKYSGEMGSFDGKGLLSHFRSFGLREGRDANSARYYGSSAWK